MPTVQDATGPWWQQGAAAILGSLALVIAGWAKRVWARRRNEEREFLREQITVQIERKFAERLAAEINLAVVHETNKVAWQVELLLRRVDMLANRHDENRDEVTEQIERLRRLVRSRHQGL